MFSVGIGEALSLLKKRKKKVARRRKGMRTKETQVT